MEARVETPRERSLREEFEAGHLTREQYEEYLDAEKEIRVCYEFDESSDIKLVDSPTGELQILVSLGYTGPFELKPEHARWLHAKLGELIAAKAAA